ncbi:beige/beach-related [Anaeramoeba flamelloides]|uniref:Beige/beach-related n=1 Tax=Anaeramoeba flamelloides TaxID=1746091 RepID=A0ABQ8XN27_9EUKA|nr:beige/beach-related [Anaeramoeba flamelloides]
MITEFSLINLQLLILYNKWKENFQLNKIFLKIQNSLLDQLIQLFNYGIPSVDCIPLLITFFESTFINMINVKSNNIKQIFFKNQDQEKKNEKIHKNKTEIKEEEELNSIQKYFINLNISKKDFYQINELININDENESKFNFLTNSMIIIQQLIYQHPSLEFELVSSNIFDYILDHVCWIYSKFQPNWIRNKNKEKKMKLKNSNLNFTQSTQVKKNTKENNKENVEKEKNENGNVEKGKNENENVEKEKNKNEKEKEKENREEEEEKEKEKEKENRGGRKSNNDNTNKDSINSNNKPKVKKVNLKEIYTENTTNDFKLLKALQQFHVQQLFLNYNFEYNEKLLEYFRIISLIYDQSLQNTRKKKKENIKKTKKEGKGKREKRRKNKTKKDEHIDLHEKILLILIQNLYENFENPKKKWKKMLKLTLSFDPQLPIIILNFLIEKFLSGFNLKEKYEFINFLKKNNIVKFLFSPFFCYQINQRANNDSLAKENENIRKLYKITQKTTINFIKNIFAIEKQVINLKINIININYFLPFFKLNNNESNNDDDNSNCNNNDDIIKKDHIKINYLILKIFKYLLIKNYKKTLNIPQLQSFCFQKIYQLLLFIPPKGKENQIFTQLISYSFEQIQGDFFTKLDLIKEILIKIKNAIKINDQICKINQLQTIFDLIITIIGNPKIRNYVFHDLIKLFIVIFKGNTKFAISFNKSIGYTRFSEAILPILIEKDSITIYKQLIKLLVFGEKIEKDSTFYIKNPDVIIMLFYLYSSFDSIHFQKLLKLFIKICKNCSTNISCCCSVGLLQLLIQVLPSRINNAPLAKDISILIQILGNNSITVKELKTIFRLFHNQNINGQIFTPACKPLLLYSVQNMIKQKQNETELSFHFNGKTSCIKIPKMDFPNNNYTFCTWIYLTTLIDQDDNPNYQPMIFSLISENKKSGIEAFFDKHITLKPQKHKNNKETITKIMLTIRTIHSSDNKTITDNENNYSVATFPLNDIKEKKWFFLCFSHYKRSNEKDQIKLYINDQLIDRKELKYPTNLNFKYNYIGTNIEHPYINRINHFYGKISSIYFFNKRLPSNTINWIWCLGKKNTSNFKSNTFTQLALKNKKKMKKIKIENEEKIASLFFDDINTLNINHKNLSKHIWLNYNPKAINKNYCLDQCSYPIKRKDGEIIGIFQNKNIQIKDVINCLGGIKIFFPLFEQLDQPYATLENIQIKKNENIDYFIDKFLCSQILDIISELLLFPNNQTEMLLCDGFKIISHHFNNINPKHITHPVTLILKQMLDMINNDELYLSLIQDLILDFQIWIYCHPQIQLEIFIIIEHIVQHNNEEIISTKELLQIYYNYYWLEPNKYSKGINPKVDPINKRIIAKRPIIEEIKFLRKQIFRILKIIIEKFKKGIDLDHLLLSCFNKEVIKKQKVQKIIQKENINEKKNNQEKEKITIFCKEIDIYEILRFFYRFFNNKKIMFFYLKKNHTIFIPSLIKLLNLKNEKIRILILKLFIKSSILIKKYEKNKNKNNFTSLIEKNGIKNFKNVILKYPLTEKISVALFSLLTCLDRFDENFTFNENKLIFHQPLLIPIIFKLIQKFPNLVALSLLKEIGFLIINNPTNYSILSKKLPKWKKKLLNILNVDLLNNFNNKNNSNNKNGNNNNDNLKFKKKGGDETERVKESGSGSVMESERKKEIIKKFLKTELNINGIIENVIKTKTGLHFINESIDLHLNKIIMNILTKIHYNELIHNNFQSKNIKNTILLAFNYFNKITNYEFFCSKILIDFLKSINYLFESKNKKANIISIKKLKTSTLNLQSILNLSKILEKYFYSLLNFNMMDSQNENFTDNLLKTIKKLKNNNHYLIQDIILEYLKLISNFNLFKLKLEKIKTKNENKNEFIAIISLLNNLLFEINLPKELFEEIFSKLFYLIKSLKRIVELAGQRRKILFISFYQIILLYHFLKKKLKNKNLIYNYTNKENNYDYDNNDESDGDNGDDMDINYGIINEKINIIKNFIRLFLLEYPKSFSSLIILKNNQNLIPFKKNQLLKSINFVIMNLLKPQGKWEKLINNLESVNNAFYEKKNLKRIKYFSIIKKNKFNLDNTTLINSNQKNNNKKKDHKKNNLLFYLTFNTKLNNDLNQIINYQKYLHIKPKEQIRLWKSVYKNLTNDRGVWNNSKFSKKNIIRLKISQTEDNLRRRRRLVRNHNFALHKNSYFLFECKNNQILINKKKEENEQNNNNIEKKNENENENENLLKLKKVESNYQLKSDFNELGINEIESEEENEKINNLLIKKKRIQNQNQNQNQMQMQNQPFSPFTQRFNLQKIKLEKKCQIINPMFLIDGKFILTSNSIKFEIKIETKMNSNKNQSTFDKYLKNRSWKFNQIKQVYKRRYHLKQTAIEIFLTNNRTYFFNFENIKFRNQIYKKIINSGIEKLINYGNGNPKTILKRMNYTQLWKKRLISNFQYLMIINTLAGRTYNDISQYPIFPWILTNYKSETIDLNDKNNYRDLSKPIGALNHTKLLKLKKKYHASKTESKSPPFLYGSHYSSTGVPLYYLMRIEPFTTLLIQQFDGKFDHPDRLFHSISETWQNCLQNPSDVKELTPEFFYMPEFLENDNQFYMGIRANGEPLGDVVLPKWAKTPEEFIKIHRKALESEYVSKYLNNWIDLIFGYKQRGEEAEKADNVFYHLTYEGSINIDNVKDPIERKAIISQIEHFGQCPIQIFNKPHPKRVNERVNEKKPILESIFLQNINGHNNISNNDKNNDDDSNNNNSSSSSNNNNNNNNYLENIKFSINKISEYPIIFCKLLLISNRLLFNINNERVLAIDKNLNISTNSFLNDTQVENEKEIVDNTNSNIEKNGTQNQIEILNSSSSNVDNNKMDININYEHYSTYNKDNVGLLDDEDDEDNGNDDNTQSNNNNNNNNKFNHNHNKINNKYLSLKNQKIENVKSIGIALDENIMNFSNCFALTNDQKTLFVSGCLGNSFNLIKIENYQMKQNISLHKDTVTCLSIDETNSYLITGSKDSTIIIWNLIKDGKNGLMVDTNFKKMLRGHYDEITCIDVNSNWNTIVTGSKDKSILLFTLEKGKYIMSIELNSTIHFIKILPESGLICACCNDEKKIYFYSLNGKFLHFIKLSYQLICWEINKDETFLIVGDKNSNIHFFHIPSFKLIANFQVNQSIQSIYLSRRENFLFLGTNSGNLLISHLQNLKKK